MEKISSLLEESSDITPIPFDPIAADFSALKSGVIPKIPKRTHGLSETSSTVSRSSGFYSIQNPKRSERGKGKSKGKPIPLVNEGSEKVRKRKVSGTYQMSQKDPGFVRERLRSDIFDSLDPSRLNEESELSHLEKPRVTGSYQFVRSDLQTRAENQKKSEKRKRVFDKPKRRMKPVENPPESQDSIWYTDKPEGDKYWTVSADDSQKKDTSFFTLMGVCLVLSLLILTILWQFNLL